MFQVTNVISGSSSYFVRDAAYDQNGGQWCYTVGTSASGSNVIIGSSVSGITTGGTWIAAGNGFVLTYNGGSSLVVCYQPRAGSTSYTSSVVAACASGSACNGRGVYVPGAGNFLVLWTPAASSFQSTYYAASTTPTGTSITMGTPGTPGGTITAQNPYYALNTTTTVDVLWAANTSTGCAVLLAHWTGSGYTYSTVTVPSGISSNGVTGAAYNPTSGLYGIRSSTGVLWTSPDTVTWTSQGTPSYSYVGTTNTSPGGLGCVNTAWAVSAASVTGGTALLLSTDMVNWYPSAANSYLTGGTPANVQVFNGATCLASTYTTGGNYYLALSGRYGT
jgi:hypothetical protein